MAQKNSVYVQPKQNPEFGQKCGLSTDPATRDNREMYNILHIMNPTMSFYLLSLLVDHHYQSSGFSPKKKRVYETNPTSLFFFSKIQYGSVGSRRSRIATTELNRFILQGFVRRERVTFIGYPVISFDFTSRLAGNRSWSIGNQLA